MSIDWLWDLERALESGKSYYACQTVGRNHWAIARSADALRGVANHSASHKKFAVDILRLVSPHEITGVLYLVPTEIGDPGPRGEPNIKWACVETREAAESHARPTQGAVADLRHAGRRDGCPRRGVMMRGACGYLPLPSSCSTRAARACALAAAAIKRASSMRTPWLSSKDSH